MTDRYRVLLTPEAQADLLALYDYLAEHGSADRALRYIERIEGWCKGLEHFPERACAGMTYDKGYA